MALLDDPTYARAASEMEVEVRASLGRTMNAYLAFTRAIAEEISCTTASSHVEALAVVVGILSNVLAPDEIRDVVDRAIAEAHAATARIKAGERSLDRLHEQAMADRAADELLRRGRES